MGMALYQFNYLRELQKELDARILNGRAYDEKIATKSKIARFAELGELLNEVPTIFKHWKHTAVDNREKALIEYVDALHFQLSLLNYYRLTSDKYCDYEYVQLMMRRPSKIDRQPEIYHLLQLITISDDQLRATCNLLKLGVRLGFKWEEIYSAYLLKNKINHMRQDEGY